MIALIDYENIGSLEGVSLMRYERVVLFTGPQQEYIRFPARTLAGDISLQVIQVPAISKNNVDFHLVLELGRLSAVTESGTVLHVISNDKGYDGVISRLRGSGRECARIEVKRASPTAVAPQVSKCNAGGTRLTVGEINEVADRIVALLRRVPKSMPGTPKSLNNFIRSHIGRDAGSEAAIQVREELARRGVMTVYEKTVTWLRVRKQSSATKS